MKNFTPIFIILFLVNTIGSVFGATTPTLVLPKPGTMVHLSPSFAAPTLRGIKIHKEDPFRFDFVLDQGDTQTAIEKTEAERLVKYFLAAVTTPQGDLWVNLSPYEKERIVPESFGQTEMGRDLLAQDYILKQLTASIIYPESKTGKEFWAKVYAQAATRFGTTNVPINTFNKVWIVPAEAEVYENATSGSAYIVNSSLKVLLEGDYLAYRQANVAFNKAQKPQEAAQTQKLGTDIVRDVVIPLLTREVNEGQNFSTIRQVYNSLILATWYKKKLKSSVLSQAYANQNKTAGIQFQDPQTNEKIYQEYLEAFKVGAYNYIKEEQDPLTQKTIPRKYFSGGASFAMTASTMRITNQAMTVEPKKQQLIEVGLNFIGVTPLFPSVVGDNAMATNKKAQVLDVKPAEVSRRSFLTTAAKYFVGGTAIVLAGDSKELIRGVVVAGYPIDVQTRLEAIIKDQNLSNELRAQQLKEFLNDYVKAQIVRIKEETKALFAKLESAPSANLIVVYEGNKDDLTLRPIDATQDTYIDQIRTDIQNLFKVSGDTSSARQVNDIIESVLYGYAEPWQMAKRANPQLFTNRSVQYVYMSADTLNNQDNLSKALESLKSQSSVPQVVTINPRNTNPLIQQPWADVVKSKLPRTQIVVATQTSISPRLEGFLSSIISNPKYFTNETASSLGTTLQGLIRFAKLMIINRVLDHHKRDLEDFQRFLNNITSLAETSNEPITIVQFVVTDNPEKLNTEPVMEEAILSNAVQKRDKQNTIIDLIWKNGGNMDFSGEDALQYAKIIAEFSLLNLAELLLIRNPQLGKKKISVLKVYVPGDNKVIERIYENRNNLTRFFINRYITAKDWRFLDNIVRARTVEEVDEYLSKNAVEWKGFRDRVRAIQHEGFEYKFKGGETYLKELDQRIEDEKERIRIAQSQGNTMALRWKQIMSGSFGKGLSGTIITPISLDASGSFRTNFTDTSNVQTFLVPDKAMKSARTNDQKVDTYGGIDLNDLNLSLNRNSEAITFDLTPELLERARNASGLAPVILNIFPLVNLKEFLK